MNTNNLFIARAVITALLCLSFGKDTTTTVAAVLIDINPDQYTDTDLYSDIRVQISCTPGDLTSVAKDIALIKISKKGDDQNAIAEVHQSGLNGLKNISKGGVAVLGYIDEKVVNSFLNVTLLKPNINSTGEYECTMYYTDQAGSFQESVSKQTFTYRETDASTLKAVIQGLAKRMEKKTNSLESRIAELEAGVSIMREMDSVVLQKVTSNEKQIQKQAEKLKGAFGNENMEGRSVFYVHLKFTGTLNAGRNVICGFTGYTIKSEYFDEKKCSYTIPATGSYRIGGYMTQVGYGTLDMYVVVDDHSWTSIARTYDVNGFVRGTTLARFEKGTVIKLGVKRTSGSANLGSSLSFYGFLI